MISRIITFFKEVMVELKKVNWLTLRQVTKYTLLVILISFIVAAFLGTIDFVVTMLVEKFVF